MLLRCLVVVENPQQARMIKIIGGFLLLLRFADWPYEISTYYLSLSATNNESFQPAADQPVVCYVAWEPGVLYLGFIADTLANLFFGGLFLYRLRKHLAEYRWVTHYGDNLDDRIEKLARKSLICLIIGICCNLVMNLLKITSYIGAASDDLTCYFNIAESTLVVEALRGDPYKAASDYVCENCGIQMTAKSHANSKHSKFSKLSSMNRTAVDLEQQVDEVDKVEEVDEAQSIDIPDITSSSVNGLVQASSMKDSQLS
ncbi:hypothetical protein BC937DRAFT_87394 [Endogone sp. FLAS-F59071]|nr:hypothetical protein BC937DRAFT_87394 [Endogone sp. FLAS-F59071]|eukprot:RUS19491.1 hypothetical protein BC937DRAFT_87394 [Endogone sp. FLAS-F59071]